MDPIFTVDMMRKHAEVPDGYTIAVTYNPEVDAPMWECKGCSRRAGIFRVVDNVGHEDHCRWVRRNNGKLDHLIYVTTDRDEGRVIPYRKADFPKIKAAAIARINTALAVTSPEDLIDGEVKDETGKIPYNVTYDPLHRWKGYWFCRFCYSKCTDAPPACSDLHSSACFEREKDPRETIYDRLIWIVGPKNPHWPQKIYLSYLLNPKAIDRVEATREEFKRIYEFARKHRAELKRGAQRKSARGESLFDRADVEAALEGALTSPRAVPGRRRSLEATSPTAKSPTHRSTAARRGSLSAARARAPSRDGAAASTMALPTYVPPPPKPPTPPPEEAVPPEPPPVARRSRRTESFARRVSTFAKSGFGPSARAKAATQATRRGAGITVIEETAPKRRSRRSESVSERLRGMLVRSHAEPAKEATSEERRRRVTRMHGDASNEESKGHEA